MSVRRLLVLLAALLLGVACAGAQDTAADGGAATTAEAVSPEASSPATEATGAPAEGGGGELTVAGTDLGEILVDPGGMTVYIFDNDTGATSTCTGDCEANWPPVSGDVSAGAGVEAGLLGTTERDDGSSQATYDGHPLYLFAGDQAAGDTNGQGVGGIWWVVAPDGAKITDGAATEG